MIYRFQIVNEAIRIARKRENGFFEDLSEQSQPRTKAEAACLAVTIYAREKYANEEQEPVEITGYTKEILASVIKENIEDKIARNEGYIAKINSEIEEKIEEEREKEIIKTNAIREFARTKIGIYKEAQKYFCSN